MSGLTINLSIHVRNLEDEATAKRIEVACAEAVTSVIGRPPNSSWYTLGADFVPQAACA